MCGRFTLTTDIQSILDEFNLESPAQLEQYQRYNVAPSQPIMAILADPQPRLEILEWGFVPSWAKEEKDFKPVINARSETVAKKPYFRGAFRSGRCAILADGFYEWKRSKGGKRPFWIHLAAHGPFAFGGLASHRILSDGTEQHMGAIVTTEANEMMAKIHNRMPVILTKDRIADWIDPNARGSELEELMKPVDSSLLEAREVSTYVNNPRNESPDCIKALED